MKSPNYLFFYPDICNDFRSLDIIFSLDKVFEQIFNCSIYIEIKNATIVVLMFCSFYIN